MPEGLVVRAAVLPRLACPRWARLSEGVRRFFLAISISSWRRVPGAGRTIPVWFEATRPGEYEPPCAELCGFGHSGMKGSLYVHAPADFQRWVAEQWPPAGEAAAEVGR